MSTRTLFDSTGPETPSTAPGKTVWAHCDGGARGNPGPAGYGAVIADEAGRSLAELSEYLGKRTNNYAEYSGLLGVLQWSLDHGVAHLKVVSDSELMVKQIQGRYKVNSPELRPLFEEARRRIARLDSFEIRHALRHKNKDADRLANEAMDRGTGRTQAKPGGPPISVEQPILKQARGVREAHGGEGGAAVARALDAPEMSAASGSMLRGFVRDGVVHLLGGKTLPDGSFVKVIAE